MMGWRPVYRYDELRERGYGRFYSWFLSTNPFWLSAAVMLVAIPLFAGPIALLALVGAAPPQRLRDPARDAIISCLEKEGVLVYAVSEKGPPPIGKPVTADMFAVVCVGEK